MFSSGSSQVRYRLRGPADIRLLLYCSRMTLYHPVSAAVAVAADATFARVGDGSRRVAMELPELSLELTNTATATPSRNPCDPFTNPCDPDDRIDSKMRKEGLAVRTR